MSETKRIRVLVVEDHIVVREGLCALISARPDMEVVGQASNGVEAVLQARALQPDVILMDLWMPRKSGVEAIGEIKADDPGARILVLTSFAEDQKVFQAIKAGALGYLLKDTSSRDLVQAIRKVHQGELALNHTIALKVVRELGRPPGSPRTAHSLTERELEVLKLVAQGWSNPEIAAALNIVERTVTTHVSNILGKLHLANRTQAALYAIRKGLIDPKDFKDH
ncbi:MAG: response regulator transcription factor [Anaerolineales bacterium]|nr:response regulator transcription factor [Anaerolineales bacterium]